MNDFPELLPFDPGIEEPRQNLQPDLRLEDLLGFFRELIPDYDKQVSDQQYEGTSCTD